MSYALRLCSCLLLILASGGAMAAEILVLLPLPGYSHTMPFMPIFKELGRRGHRLTMITPFPQDPLPKGFNEIPVDLNITTLNAIVKEKMGDINPRSMTSGPMFQLIGLWPFCKLLTPFLLEKVKAVLPPPGTKFDLIITEPFFCTESLLVSSHLYKAPIVATLPLPLQPSVASAVGNPLLMSYVPSGRLPYSDNMNFCERLWNVIVSAMEVITHHLMHLPTMDKLMREILGFKDAPYITDYFRNISLVLSSTHFTMNYIRPMSRNVIEVAGVSTSTVKPLPKDLEKFVNEAKDGVILFSWGSHYEAKDADLVVKSMMDTFSKIKQRVIFKWSNSSIPNKPNNVLIQKWLPQPSILAHKNTVLFISHCGQNSIYEAAYFGVPVVGTPLFGDQIYNLRILESSGMAVKADIDDIEKSTEPLTSAINKILSNPSYKENAIKKGNMLKDRPMPPLDEAIYWIEYVMKYGGGQLQPAAQSMPWYRVALLDVGALIFGVIAIALSFVCCTLCFCISKCKRSKPVKKQASKEKKNK